VPCRRTDLGQKQFHLCLVREQLAVEVPRVPVEKDATHIEDHRRDRRLDGKDV
jgi:hypothetical protein